MSVGIYLDHAATTPIAAEVVEAMRPLLGGMIGNPSSPHQPGRRARAVIDDARDRIAARIGAQARELVFLSGGSEANNLALRGALDRGRGRGRHLVISAIEHDAVLRTAEVLVELDRAELTVVPPQPTGTVDIERMAAAVRDDTVLVSLMLANNEVGTIQDVAGLAELVRARNRGALIHTDAVQALGRIPVDVGVLGVDLLSVSAHKVYGPKGTGALWVRGGVPITAQVNGGGQERNRRSGTENVAGIAGFAAAVDLVETERETEMPRQAALAARLRERVSTQLPEAVMTGASAAQLAPFATFAFSAVRSDVLLTALDRAGVWISGGSACSSGAALPSHVLAAMGLPATLAGGALRCTLGRDTIAADIDAAAAAIVTCVRRAQTTGREGARAMA